MSDNNEIIDMSEDETFMLNLKYRFQTALLDPKQTLHAIAIGAREYNNIFGLPITNYEAAITRAEQALERLKDKHDL